MTKMACIQHVRFETPALIGTWAESKGMQIQTYMAGEAQFPALESFDWLLIMGGPMGVYEEDKYPWLKDEMTLIQAAISGGKKVIGVCLGAQLIAAAMGARVYANDEKEIGWFKVSATKTGQDKLNLPEEFTVFQWHGDTFDWPESVEPIAIGQVAERQAFMYDNRVLALQFHLESTAQSVCAICENCADELVHAKYIQTAEQMQNDEASLRASNAVMFQMLDRLCDIS